MRGNLGSMSTELSGGAGDRRRHEAAMGVAVFAATLSIMVGLFQAIQGVVALANDSFFVAGAKYVFQFDLTTWGWAHLLLGALLIVVGIFLLKGASWARWTAVVLAVVSAVANFMWLPHYPLWSILVIAADVAIIWALTAHGRAIDHALR